MDVEKVVVSLLPGSPVALFSALGKRQNGSCLTIVSANCSIVMKRFYAIFFYGSRQIQ